MRADSSSVPRVALACGMAMGLMGCSLFVSLSDLDDVANDGVDAADATAAADANDANDAASSAGDSSALDAKTPNIAWRDTRSVAFPSSVTAFPLPAPMTQMNDVLVAVLALGSTGNPSPPGFTAP